MLRQFVVVITATLALIALAACAVPGAQPGGGAIPGTGDATATSAPAVTETVPVPTATAVSATATSAPATATMEPSVDVPVAGTDVKFVMAIDDATMYAGPGETYEAIGTIADGQTAFVTGADPDGAWWRVICPDDTIGNCWVSADTSVTQPTEPPGEQLDPTTLHTEVAYVMAQEDVTIYAGPGDTHDEVGTIFGGQMARVYGISLDEAWWRVICPDDTLGNCWVSADPGLTQPASAPTVSGAQATCPEATAETVLLENAEHGYCLLYPSEYTVERPNEDETVLVIGGLLNVQDPRLHITVTDAEGRSLEQVADQLEADYAIPGMPVERTAAEVAGAPAVVLDKLPGQEINRRVVFIHDGRLFNLMFAPADDTLGDVYTRMEELYATVLDSFTFLIRS